MSKSKWLVDPAHSQISFKVRHLMITTVTGYFKEFSVEVETDSDDFTTASRIVFTANVASIDTGSTQRDQHLRSADFFDVNNHPQLMFVGTQYEGNDEEGKIYGELTIKEVTKPVMLNIEHAGIVVDPYGQTKAGFTLQTRISRKEFGLTWSATTEAGHIVVGDEIKIMGEIQLIKQAAEPSLQSSKTYNDTIGN
jgi:polyisoprenoid-binding protein YceI